MTKVMFKSLSFRLVVFLLLVGLVVFIPMAVLIINHNQRTLEKQVLAEALTVHKLIINTTRYSMLKNDNEAIAQSLESLKSIPKIVSVRIFGKSGVVFSTTRGEAGKPAAIDDPSCAVCHRGERPLTAIPDADATRITVAADGRRVLTNTTPIENSAACSAAGCHPPPEQQRIMGIIESTVSLAEADRQTAGGRLVMIVFVALAILLLESSSALFIWRYVHRRVAHLSATSRRVAEGDYSCRSQGLGDDEIGQLAAAFNTMMSRVEQNRGDNLALIENLRNASSVLGGSCSELLGISTEQAAGATEQMATIHELVATSQELSAAAGNIAENADALKASAQRARQACQTGQHYVEKSVAGMDRIGDKFKGVAGRVAAATDQAGRIGGIVDLIEEISDQTELLALNAAIEAAGAGEAGQRFGVVAEEVRRLAGKIAQSTALIRQSIDLTRESVAEIEALSREEEVVVGEGMESVRQLATYFEEVIRQVEGTLKQISQISLISRQQTSASKEMVDSIQEVEKVAEGVRDTSKHLESLVAELNGMTERLSQLSG